MSLTARVICLDQVGAAADWSLNSAYRARYFSIPESDRPGFAKADEDWLDLVRRKCAKVQDQRECVLSAYRKRAAAYRSRLEGDALIESRLSPEQHAQIQQQLITLGLLDDTPDGLFGPNTRAAIKRYKTQSGAPESDFLTAEQREQLLQGKLSRLSIEARKSWQLVDANVKYCVNRLLQTGGQSIDMLIERGVVASDPSLSAHFSNCQKISSENLLKNFDCVLDVGPTRCDEVYVLSDAQTTPLNVEQATTAMLSHREIGKARIENTRARENRLEALTARQKEVLATEALNKLKQLLNTPNNKMCGKATELSNKIQRATELRKQIEDARSNPKIPIQVMEKINISASDLLMAYNDEVERVREWSAELANHGEVEVCGEGSGTSENAARINSYYDIFDKQLRDLIGTQSNGTIGRQFRKDANTSFDKFKTDFFASATNDTCNKTSTVFNCVVEGIFKLDSLKNELETIMRVPKSYRFILGYEETDNAPTRFLIDKIRAEFVNAGYTIIAKSGEEEAKARGEFDYYINILDIEYDDSKSDVGSIGGAGTSLFENYILKARVKLLDNKRDPAARKELANIPVIDARRVRRDAATPRAVRRDELLPMQANDLARKVYRDVSAGLLRLAAGQSGPESVRVLGPGQYSIKIVGLTPRDREKIRALRKAVSKVLPGAETKVDPQGTRDRSVEIRFEYKDKFDPEDINDALYEIFKESKTFEVRYEGNNSFVGSL